ncbi:MAG TPA: hypothetical protein VFV19_02085 [Candidatus Polarisedimenticolaceae bacterium]|nr:hypothetical protein [Candidatus Polarisedimenticolaceae bacterium]
MTKVLKSVGVLSVGKTALVVYGCLGFFIGAIVALFSVIGGMAGMLGDGNRAAGAMSMFFGVGAVIFFPVLYGGFGALTAMLLAAVYNVAARAFGGIEFETGESPSQPVPPR